MTPRPNRRIVPQTLRRAWYAVLAVLAAVLTAFLASCGGGGVGTGGTGSFSQSYTAGPISGFGSVIVNGVRFDDSTASFEDDTGGGRDRSALRLGMTVEIVAGSIDDSTSPPAAVAQRIRLGSELVGSVEALDVAAGRFTLVGQTVQVDAATVFDDRLGSGIASLRDGLAVEVYGFHDASRTRFVASRIEPRDSAPASFKVRAPVQSIDAARSTLVIDGATYDYAGLTPPIGLGAGSFVRLRVATLRDVSGAWRVLAFERAIPDLGASTEARLRGLITAFDSAARFAVNGVPVDGSGTTPTGGTLVLGARVEVEGPLQAGTVIARRIEIEDEDRAREVEMRGVIDSVDVAGRLLRLRNRPETVTWDAGVEFDPRGFGPADLRPGIEIEVRGTIGGAGNAIVARRIKRRD